MPAIRRLVPLQFALNQPQRTILHLVSDLPLYQQDAVAEFTRRLVSILPLPSDDPDAPGRKPRLRLVRPPE